ncbi:MAG: hypothetical protein IKC75_05145 [Clostridia bacterium]|nr:hypothetical protein [Clostridia bacterium]
MENENRKTALVPISERALAPIEGEHVGYWARVGQLYRAATFVLLFLLALFLVTFSVLFAHAFTYDSIFYFGKDIAALSTLPDGNATVYYDYKGEDAVPAPYRAGVAVAHRGGIDVYAANSERYLSVAFQKPYAAPRISVSRNYLVAYDFGATSFCVCNSYAMLFEGQTDAPIYGIFLSDSGYFTVITGSTTSLSEVLLYDADFNLRQRFGRATATVAAPISDNGRTVALVGASAGGTVIDVYVIGDEKPLSETKFEGFPLAADYTSSTKLAVVTDVAVTALSTEGKIFDTVSFRGAQVAACSIGEQGIALALEVDRIAADYRVLALDKRGNVETDVALSGPVRALSLSDDVMFVLGTGAVTAVRLNRTEEVLTMSVPEEALSLASAGELGVRVLTPTEALHIKVDR